MPPPSPGYPFPPYAKPCHPGSLCRTARNTALYMSCACCTDCAEQLLELSADTPPPQPQPHTHTKVLGRQMYVDPARGG